MHESRRILETVVYESARITQTLFASQDWSLDNSESAHSAVRTVASMNSPMSSSSIGDSEERKRGEERTSMARNVDCPVGRPENSLNESKRRWNGSEKSSDRRSKTKSRRRATNANASASAYASDVTNHNWRPSSLG